MINNFRKKVQAKLNTVDTIEPGKIISDDMIKDNVYHFGYIITTSVYSNNLDYSNDNMILNITGYLTTKGGTLAAFDKCTDDICNALSELRIKCTTKDITTYDTIHKVMITGTVNYSTLDELLR